MLLLERASKSFLSAGEPLWVLRDIDLRVDAGEMLAVVGPSGSGKSTLLSICAGLDRPSSGSVVVNGVDLNRLSEDQLSRFRNENIGFVFQAFHLIPSLTALENVMVPGELRGRSDCRSAAGAMLETVQLAHRMAHYPSQLSGGEQQRVALARAFLNRPKLLFADEPTGNLDEETATIIQTLLFDLQKRSGTTLLIATHNMEFAAQTNRILRLRQGKLDLAS